MGIKELSFIGALMIVLSPAPVFCDTISGSGGAGFQSWAVTNLNENGSPYWDNPSMDGSKQNVGFYLVDAPTAPLTGAPGALPFWGNSFSSNTDSGGSADLNFFFQRNASSSSAILKLEVAGRSNLNEFGWYDIQEPSILHPLFAGPDAALDTNNFSPSSSYGFYLKSDSSELYYTQSSLNSGGDTNHQHFAIFRESSTTGAESYWIGVEDLAANEFNGHEGNVGDYQDMLIRISVASLPSVPEPSTAMLVVSGSLLAICLTRRRARRLRGRGQQLRRRQVVPFAEQSSP